MSDRLTVTKPARALPRPLSLTHQHILAVVASELAARGPRGDDVALLDAGCGDGLLIEYLAAALPHLRPAGHVRLTGFDVADHGVQEGGYLGRARARLEAATGDDWSERLALVTERDPWPFPDASQDVVVSNQVLEHVADHPFFFSELARVLRPGGFSVHLFPLGHVLVEPHLGVPIAHWFGSADMIGDVIRWSGRLGIGRYRAGRDGDLAAYAAAHADYVVRFTNYRTAAQMIADAKRVRLHASFRYTPHYYAAKLRALAGRSPLYRYDQPGAGHAAAALALRYVSSATLVLRRDHLYGSGPASPGGSP